MPASVFRFARVFALVCLLAGVAGRHTAEAASTNDPVAVVQSIYKQEIGSSGVDWSDRAKRPLRLTTALCDLWTRAEKKTPKGDALIDFDLPADTNGLTLTGYDPKLGNRDADAATVAVTVRYDEKSESPHVVSYKLVRERGAWKIDDISTKRWSLRQMLGLALK